MKATSLLGGLFMAHSALFFVACLDSTPNLSHDPEDSNQPWASEVLTTDGRAKLGMLAAYEASEFPIVARDECFGFVNRATQLAGAFPTPVLTGTLTYRDGWAYSPAPTDGLHVDYGDGHPLVASFGLVGVTLPWDAHNSGLRGEHYFDCTLGAEDRSWDFHVTSSAHDSMLDINATGIMLVPWTDEPARTQGLSGLLRSGEPLRVALTQHGPTGYDDDFTMTQAISGEVSSGDLSMVVHVSKTSTVPGDPSVIEETLQLSALWDTTDGTFSATDATIRRLTTDAGLAAEPALWRADGAIRLGELDYARLGVALAPSAIGLVVGSPEGEFRLDTYPR